NGDRLAVDLVGEVWLGRRRERDVAVGRPGSHGEQQRHAAVACGRLGDDDRALVDRVLQQRVAEQHRVARPQIDVQWRIHGDFGRDAVEAHNLAPGDRFGALVGLDVLVFFFFVLAADDAAHRERGVGDLAVRTARPGGLKAARGALEAADRATGRGVAQLVV